MQECVLARANKPSAFPTLRPAPERSACAEDVCLLTSGQTAHTHPHTHFVVLLPLRELCTGFRSFQKLFLEKELKVSSPHFAFCDKDKSDDINSYQFFFELTVWL